MSAMAVSPEIAEPLPHLYIASPLTALAEDAKRQILSDVHAVKSAVVAETLTNRIDSERWPVAVYAPIDSTAPWSNDGLSPRQVYRQNLDIVHRSDALIVVAENGASAGVGQELEWATRLGLPILYLSAGLPISRQIDGAPAFLQSQSYNGDAATLESHVNNFLRRWKPLILDGPRRRASRNLRFESVTLRLRAAWQSARDRTGIAAQIRVNIDYLEIALSDPSLVSVMPIETLIGLAHELNVSLTSLSPTRVSVLPVAALRALMAAAEEGGWPDGDVERLIHSGRESLESGDSLDLSTIAAWHTLRDNAA